MRWVGAQLASAGSQLGWRGGAGGGGARLGLLGGVGAVLIGKAWLGARGRPGAAAGLLALLALPGEGYALFVILVIASGARWD